MAVTKIWPVHDSLDRVTGYCNNPEKTEYSDLRQVLMYAADPGKTDISKEYADEGERRFAVTGINCRPETAAEEMRRVQERFGKGTGNIAYHAYQSFKTGEISAEECHRVGVETAKNLWGKNFQVLVATHYNTGTYHNHFVINSTSLWDGHKLEAKYRTYNDFRTESDRICRERGLTVIEDPQRHKTPRSVYIAEKNGEPTRYSLMRQALDEAMTMSATWGDLADVMYRKGYIIEAGPHRKYVTIRSLCSEKAIRTFRLGEAYGKEALQDRLIENCCDLSSRRKYYEFMQPYQEEYVRYHPPGKEYYERRDFYFRMLKLTGYSAFFRCIAVIFGLEPVSGDTYVRPLSPECREACRRLDRYSDEIRLEVREKFESAEDIQRFILKCDGEIERISEERSRIRNRQRNVKAPDEKERLKAECGSCTARLEKIRKDRKTAVNILEDHPELQRILEAETETMVLIDPNLSREEKEAALEMIRQGAEKEKDTEAAEPSADEMNRTHDEKKGRYYERSF